MRITILGAGPAGLASALRLSRLGAEITLIDKNPRLIAGLWNGRLPSAEPGLEAIFAADPDFGIDAAPGLKRADAALIAVDTPEKRGEPSPAHLRTAAAEIAASARRGLMVLVRSSLSVGESARLELEHGLAFIPHPFARLPGRLADGGRLLFGTQDGAQQAFLTQLHGGAGLEFAAREEAELRSFAYFRRMREMQGRPLLHSACA